MDWLSETLEGLYFILIDANILELMLQLIISTMVL
jgi:hypothetical protein